jgi:heme/copper-type cytochrome/quinol oxidase subunit 2
LKVSKSEKKRSRAVIVLLLPVVVILWIFGWSLYWISRQRESGNSEPASSPQEEDNVTLAPLVLETTSELEN